MTSILYSFLPFDKVQGRLLLSETINVRKTVNFLGIFVEICRNIVRISGLRNFGAIKL